LQKLRVQELESINVPKIIGAVFGLGAVLFSHIPKELVERHVSDYARYLDVVFTGTMLVVGYAFLILLPLWIQQSRTRLRAQRVRAILEYVVIQLERSSENDG
jgi:hypothetical protein